MRTAPGDTIERNDTIMKVRIFFEDACQQNVTARQCERLSSMSVGHCLIPFYKKPLNMSLNNECCGKAQCDLHIQLIGALGSAQRLVVKTSYIRVNWISV